MSRIARIGTVIALALLIATRLLETSFHAFGYLLSVSISTHPYSRTVAAQKLLGGLIALDLVVIALAVSGMVFVIRGRSKAALAATAGAVTGLGLCLLVELIVLGRQLARFLLMIDFGPATLALAGAVAFQAGASRTEC